MQPLRIAAVVGTGFVSLGASAFVLAGPSDAAPKPTPTAPSSTASPTAQRPVIRVTRVPSGALSVIPVAPSTSAGGGGIVVPAGGAPATREDANSAVPLALGGAGLLLVAGGATAAVRRRV